MVLIFVIMLEKEIAIEANYDINQTMINSFITPDFPDIMRTDNLTSEKTIQIFFLINFR